MKKTLIVFICLLATGCAVIKNPINNNTLGAIIDSYGLAETAFIAYKSLPRCTVTHNFSATNICHKRSVVVAGVAYDKQVGDAIDMAVAFQRTNPTLDASSLIEAAQAALEAFKTFETKNGVN